MQTMHYQAFGVQAVLGLRGNDSFSIALLASALAFGLASVIYLYELRKGMVSAELVRLVVAPRTPQTAA